MAWEVTDPFLLESIHAHWSYTSTSPLTSWFDETERFCPRTPQELASQLPGTHLSSDQIQSLHHVLTEIRQLGGTDMYVKPESCNTIPHTLNVVGVLLRWGVPLPRLQPFARSKWSERSGWGQPVPRSFFHDGDADLPTRWVVEVGGGERKDLLLNQIVAGAASAEEEIAAGLLRIYRSGSFPPPWWLEEMRHIFREEYGVDYLVPLPMEGQDPEMSRAYRGGYNQRMKKEVEARFGPRVFNEVYAEARKRQTGPVTDGPTR